MTTHYPSTKDWHTNPQSDFSNSEFYYPVEHTVSSCHANIILVNLRISTKKKCFGKQGIVCKMFLWWTKNISHPINVRGIYTNVVPLCSVEHAPSSEIIFTWLAWVSTIRAHLSRLFILEMACTGSRINTMHQWTNFVETGVSNVKQGSDAGAWSTEHNDLLFVVICPILRLSGKLFNYYSNIWQTLGNLAGIPHSRHILYVIVITMGGCTLSRFKRIWHIIYCSDIITINI